MVDDDQLLVCIDNEAAARVNVTLHSTDDQPRRTNALARLAEIGDAGAFDELLDKTIYRRPSTASFPPSMPIL